MSSNSYKTACLLFIYFLTGNIYLLSAQSSQDSLIDHIKTSFGNDSLVHFLEKKVYHQDLEKTEKNELSLHLAQAYNNIGSYENAIVVCNKLFKLKLQDSTETKAQIYSESTTALYNLGQYQEAIQQAEKEMNIRLYQKDTSEIFLVLLRVGVLYQETGNNEKAISRYKEAQALQTNVPDKYDAYLYNSLSVAYSAIDDHASSIIYIQKTIQEDRNAQPFNSNNLASSYNNAAGTYIEMNQFDHAILYLDSCNAIVQKNTIDKRYQQTLHDNYAAAFIGLGKHREAQYHFNIYRDIVKEELHKRQENKIKELEVLYEKEKAFIQAEQQQQAKTLRLQTWLLALLTLVLVLTVGFFLYTYRNIQKLNLAQIDTIKTEQQLLRSQMNPHFVFNTISVIQSLILAGDSKLASKCLKLFSRLMRLMLENASSKLVSLEKEMEAIDKYVSLQSVRFSDAFQYEETIDENINMDGINIPPMLIQPFIENAIEHGIRNQKNGKINLRLYLQNEQLICEIEDNGIGIHQSRANKTKSPDKKSMATTITEKRLKSLGKELGMPAHILIQDKSVQGTQGTFVKMIIPYDYL